MGGKHSGRPRNMVHVMENGKLVLIQFSKEARYFKEDEKMINETMINQMVKEELAAANAAWPPFTSTHEGYAVIKEEVEEAAHDFRHLEGELEFIWQQIKQNHPENVKKAVDRLRASAIRSIQEIIQIAAMSDKMLPLLPGAERQKVCGNCKSADIRIIQTNRGDSVSLDGECLKHHTPTTRGWTCPDHTWRAE